MVYKKIANPQGDYVDVNENRFDVLEAQEAYTPQGKNAGWDEYPNVETALQAYGLTYNPIEPKEE